MHLSVTIPHRALTLTTLRFAVPNSAGLSSRAVNDRPITQSRVINLVCLEH